MGHLDASAFAHEDAGALAPHMDRLGEALAKMPTLARPRFPIFEDEHETPEDEPTRWVINVEVDPRMFSPLETREILAWARAHSDPVHRLPVGCDCLEHHDTSKPFGLLVFRVFHRVEWDDEHAFAPSIVFECLQCGRRVFYGEWDDLRRARRGFEVLDGGGAGDENTESRPAPELTVVPK